MSDRRPIEQVRAEAHVVKRERVLRWLTGRLNGERLAFGSEVEKIARYKLLAELADDFANGRER